MTKFYKFNLFTFDYAGDATTSTGMSAEMREYYNKQLFEDAEPELVYDQFGEKYPIPKNNGKTIRFRRVSMLPKALAPLTEGVTPDPTHMVTNDFTATVSQFGSYIEQTDLLQLTTIDPIIQTAVEQNASQAARTVDTLIRDVLVAGTSVFYGGTGVSSRSAITSAAVLTTDMVLDIVAELRANNAPTFDGKYIAIAHPYVLRDIMASDDWTDAHKYTDPKPIFKGEVGEYGGVRFISSSEAKIWGPGEIGTGTKVERLTVKTAISASSTTVEVEETLPVETPATAIGVYIDGTANTITKIERITGATTGTKLTVGAAITSLSVGDIVCGKNAGSDGSAVFGVVFLGKKAYGLTELDGGGLQTIVKPLGAGNDPLNQRSTIGWKCTHVCKRLNELYMVRAEVGSKSSPTAVSN